MQDDAELLFAVHGRIAATKSIVKSNRLCAATLIGSLRVMRVAIER